jgi:hypothetical protein
MTELGEFAMYLAYGFIGLGFLFGPIGVAIGRRIGGRQPQQVDEAGLEEMRQRLGELEAQQARVAELEERVDFAERLLASGAPPAQLHREGGE